VTTAAAVALAAVLAGAPPAAATNAARWHFTVDGASPFQYSVLFRRDEKGDETRLLVEAGGARYELVSTQDPTGRDSTESVRALAPGEAFTRRLVLPRGEPAAGCEAVRSPDACVVLEGPRGKLTTRLSAFAGQDAGPVRERARALLSPALAERLLALAPYMKETVELDAYAEDFLGLLWPERFQERRGAPTKGVRRAGCSFDAEFGYPCSQRELVHERTHFGK